VRRAAVAQRHADGGHAEHEGEQPADQPQLRSRTARRRLFRHLDPWPLLRRRRRMLGARAERVGASIAARRARQALGTAVAPLDAAWGSLRPWLCAAMLGEQFQQRFTGTFGHRHATPSTNRARAV
jgi:hypothetical protein